MIKLSDNLDGNCIRDLCLFREDYFLIDNDITTHQTERQRHY